MRERKVLVILVSGVLAWIPILIQATKASDVSQRVVGSVDVDGAVDISNLTFSAFGELLTSGVAPETAWRFDYGINTRFVSTSVVLGAAITEDASRAKLSTGTNANGSASISSIRRLRYMPGIGGLVRMTAVFGDGKANSTQLIGLGDSRDGLFFGYNGTSFGVMRRRAGVDNWTLSTVWNGTALGETLNPQNGNIYQIRYQWLGYGLIHYYIFDKTSRSFVEVHTDLYPDTSQNTSILNPTLPLISSATNSGNATDIVMYVPSAIGAIEIQSQSRDIDPLAIWNSLDLTTNFANISNNHAMTVKNQSAFLGIDNRLPIQIRSMNLARDSGGAAITTVRIYRNAVTAGALTYSDVDINNSPVQTSTTTTTITSTNAERSYSMSVNTTSVLIPFEPGEMIIYPGESIAIAVQDNGASQVTFSATINWEELF